MKRFAIVMLLLALVSLLSISALSESAQAPADLSGLSLADLVTLKDQINIAIWNSKDWKEVTVPQGIWEVGKDIPAGHWTIKPSSENMTSITWGESLDEHKTDIDINGFIAGDVLTDEKFSLYDRNSDKTQVDYDLTDGTYVKINIGSAVFTPYDGKPAFTFN